MTVAVKRKGCKTLTKATTFEGWLPFEYIPTFYVLNILL